jgi:hypothetical protein
VTEYESLTYTVEPWWPKWISCDWGFKDDAATLWHTTAPDGKHITFREWVVNGVTPRMLGEGIAERSVDDQGRAERIQQFFLSPDAFRDTSGQSTIAEQIRESACRSDRLPYPAEASDDRVAGWALLYTLLQSHQWIVTENCRVLIGALPTLTRDDKKLEDIKQSAVDHAPDAARYGLFSRLGPAREPVEVRAARKVEGITDPTQRAIVLDKFHADEARKNQPVPLAGRFGGKRRWRPGG